MHYSKKVVSGADLAFFQGGGFDPSSTSRVAASRFVFLAILRAAKRRADFLAILRAAKRRADFFFLLFLRAAKRRADFFGYFTSREAASRFFLAILNPRK